MQGYIGRPVTPLARCPLPTAPMQRNFIAEFVGTFALVFIGGGAIIVSDGHIEA